MFNFEPNEEALALDTYRTWAHLFSQLRYYSWIIDRFHLSTRAHQLQHRQGDVDFGWLEDELRPLGFLVALLTRDPTTFGAARAERLRVFGKPDQYDDLRVFVREQDLFRRLGEETTLPLSEFDISDRDVFRVAGRIADWLEETGGLWKADG